MKHFIFYIFLICSITAFSEELVFEPYNEFLRLNEIYTETKESVLIQQSIIKCEKNGKKKSSETVYCLVHKNGQFVQIKTKAGLQYFFSSNQGYWIFNKKLKTPLKISGTYKVEEIEVQDVLKTNFKLDYKPVSLEGNILTLERKTQKAAYKFVLFENDGEIFELIFCDKNKNPVRKIVYHNGKVDKITCFNKIDIYNLLFKKDSYSSWITEKIKTVNVPSSLFTHTQIKILSQKIEGLIK